MRALGVDYGQRRIGLALSDASGMLARPWKTIPRIGNPLEVARALAGELAALSLADEAVAVLVLGYPRRLSGEANAQTAAVRQIADRLKTVIGIPIVLQDERLTSQEAEERLSRTEKDWRKRKLLLDAMSAAVILQDYLDRAAERRGTAKEDEGT